LQTCYQWGASRLCFGPLLFSLYVNEIPSLVSSSLYMFADDTKLYQSITNTSDIIALQHDLDNLNLWSSDWLLKFNISKTMVMHISNINSEHSAYFMNN